MRCARRAHARRAHARSRELTFPAPSPAVIPPDDYDFLRAAGVVGIYGPGTRITAASDELVALLKEQPDV